MTPGKKRLGLTVKNFLEEDRERAKEYECIVCKLIFSNNFALNCLHCICENCINTTEKCPEDHEVDIISEINAFNESYIGNTLLDDLSVTCIFNEKGCHWRGKFSDFYDVHLNECEFNDEKNNGKIENLYENERNKNRNRNNYFEQLWDEDENDENSNNNEQRISNKKILNRKRKLRKERNNNEKDYEKINQIKNGEIRNNNILGLKENFSIFQQKNIVNNIMLLPQNNIINNNDNSNINDREIDNNNMHNPGSILEKIFFENYNNNILIDSNLTMNSFPYKYYFTEPLDDSFSCKIEVISREIKNFKEISFGLTQVDNGIYKEILTTKNNIFLFFNKDIIKILYDSNKFYIYSENGKFNKSIDFENNMYIKYYPTIILNNENDILKVSHN